MPRSSFQRTSPWLLLNNNVPVLSVGPTYFSVLGPPCPRVKVAELQRDLAAADWHLVSEEYGYQVWSATPER